MFQSEIVQVIQRRLIGNLLAQKRKLRARDAALVCHLIQSPWMGQMTLQLGEKMANRFLGRGFAAFNRRATLQYCQQRKKCRVYQNTGLGHSGVGAVVLHSVEQFLKELSRPWICDQQVLPYECNCPPQSALFGFRRQYPIWPGPCAVWTPNSNIEDEIDQLIRLQLRSTERMQLPGFGDRQAAPAQNMAGTFHFEVVPFRTMQTSNPSL